MKLLIVMTNNYPKNGTCSNIINNLLFKGGLNDRIEQIDVLCSKSDYFENSTEVNENIHINRVFSWTLIDKSKFKETILQHKFLTIEGSFWRILNYAIKRVFKSSFIDYSTSHAFYSAIKKLNNDYDVILSISGRYDATFAIYKYVKNTNQKFILYQVDPCSTNLSYNKKSKKRRERFEFDLYDRADYVITTPIIYNEHIESGFCDCFFKIKPMEFPLVIPQSNRMIIKSTRKNINCTFIGTLYGSARNPYYTLKLFSHIIDEHVSLHLVGVTINDLPKEFKNDKIICYGRQDLESCKELIKKADFLINIGNHILNQIPSKIFEYISTGKPIINICESDSCPTIKYLNKYPESLNIIKDKEDIYTQINTIKKYIEKRHNVVSNGEINNSFYKCTPKYCANEVLSIILEVCESENKI